MIMNSFFALIATLSFCVLFNIKGKYLFFASLGGGISWFFYSFFIELNITPGASLFFSAIILGIYSETAARLLKAPVTTFVVCALIPLVPGSGMYYTMYESILGNVDKSLYLGLETLSNAGALALGIVLTSSLSRLFNSIKDKNA